MRWLNDVKIKTKLMMGFILIAFIAGIVGGIGITKIKKIDNNYSELYINYGVAISDIANVSISYQRLKLNLNKVIMDKDTSNIKQYTERVKVYNQQIDYSLEKFQKSIQTEEGRKQLENLRTLLDKYDRVTENVISLAASGKSEEGFKLMNSEETQSLADEINNAVDNLFDLKTSGGTTKSDDYSRETNYAIATMGGVIAVAIIIAVAFGFLISKSIDKSISKLMYVTKEISDGNLNVEIINDSKDEIGMFSESVRKMKYKLHEVISNISFAAEQVTVGSRQISDSTIALSQGATEQASAVEELTSSIEEISSQIKVNAENAKQANNIADNTKVNAIKGNSDMKLMLNAMSEINDSSNNIAKIIKVIDEIAFQTNILALNAAVEAARAGQYGKGFTVVAEEVRNLAARSANAAKETTQIIEESLIKIKDGTDIANHTAEALDSIVVDIQDVAKIIGDIAEASEEQATGISQISQGVVQISQVVQSNSATAEECAAASEELAGQAEVLKEQVEMFDLESGDKSNSYSKSNNNHFSMSGKENNGKKLNSINNTYTGKSKANSKQIILSDTEFGKY